MKHPISEPYAVQITTNELKTSGRRSEVARLLLSGKHKQDVIQYLMETFGMEYKQAHSEYRHAYSYIYLNCELTKEEIRKLNLSKLEELWDRAEQDELLSGKEYYKTQMKNIDITNKTAGLYDQTSDDKPKNTDINFNLNIGEKK